MHSKELQQRLAGRPLLADGGLGTWLVELGAVTVGGCFEALNAHDPDAVERAHRDFLEAGSELIETNTFGANRFALAEHGLEGRVAELNREGAGIARRATEAHGSGLVAGSVGPLRVRLRPYGRVRKADAFDAYAEQVEALAAGGVDLVLIETQSDLNEAEQALRAAREACDLAVVVGATFTRDDRTLLGSSPEQVAQRLTELGVDALGANCSEGPAQMLRLVHAMRPYTRLPILAMPNAGGPARVGDRILYPATSEYLAEHARAFLAAGASVIGGCCGTGPDHVRAMAEALRAPRQLDLDLVPAAPREADHEHEPQLTGLGEKLRDGRFVVTVEMDPPKGFSTARMLAGAETLRDAGADAIDVADSPMAKMRMSPWAPARLIQERVGVETILHFPTRGRNVLRVQGDLLAAHALGLRNLFVIMGDPVSIGDHPQATDNADVVPTGLLALVTKSFNRGVDQSGASIGEPTSFVVGAAVNLNAPDVERECRLLNRKITAGADFALSMPVYTPDALRVFRKGYEERYGPLALPILVGVLPLVTSRHAEFLHNELPGVSIPEEVRTRMREAGDGASDVGLEVAVDLAGELRTEAAGLYVMPPFGRIDLAAEIVESVGRAG